jgi:succinoglycan biosynthesis transport protein ExoP
LLQQDKIQLFESPLPRRAPRRFELSKPGALGMGEEESEFWERWRVIKRRRWTILAALLTVVTAVLIASAKEKPVYEAKALLEIEQENPNVVSVQDLFQVGNVSDDYLVTQYRILQSDTLARTVIKQLHLDQTEEFNPSEAKWPWQLLKTGSSNRGVSHSRDAAHEQEVLERFHENLDVAPVERSRLVRVSFDAQDPQLAAQVANSLAADYIQETLQMHWDATQRATSWLAQQLNDLKIKLEKSEDDLQEYAQTNGLLFLENDKGQMENIVDQRLRDLQTELTQAQAERYQRESLFRLVETGDYGALPGVFDSKVTQDLTERLAELEQQQAELAPDFKPGYPKMKQVQSEIVRVQQLLQQERAQAAKQISDQYFAAMRREALVKQAFQEQQKEANATAEKLVQYNILKREADSNKELYEGLLQRLKEAGVSAGLKASNIRIIDQAVPPTKPVKPRYAFNLLIGLFAGLCSGLALAFLQEHMDNTLKTQSDVEHILRVPALALIPSLRSLGLPKNGHHQLSQKNMAPKDASADTCRRSGLKGHVEGKSEWIRVDAEAVERSAFSEAFRSLRTSILLSAAGRPPRTLVFVSAEPRAGKTTVCCNLAIQLAQLGKRVLVVDADMRRSSAHEFFGLGPETGLANYLTGEEDWRCWVKPTGVKGLDCLPCGPEPPNPSELLSSERMQGLIRDAITDYNFVLVDSPPLLEFADGRILSTLVEGAILIIRGGSTPREFAQRAQARVADVGAHLIGIVLNDLDFRRNGYHYPMKYGSRLRGQVESADLEN